MISFILSFLLGDLCLQTFAVLPSQFICLMLLLVAAILWLVLKKQTTFSFIPLAFVLGFIWTLWFAHSISSFTLNKAWEGKPLVAIGTVSSLPRAGRFGTQFELHVEKINNEFSNTNIRLTWPEKSRTQTPHLIPGDKWQLLVKLKRIHGVQSPGAYDYEAWAFQQGIRATGSVQIGDENKLLTRGKYNYVLMKLRQRLQEKILLYSPHTQTSPWLMALILGERNGISAGDWQVLRNTGTNHLMAIGGLHIGILASSAYLIISWLWRRFTYLMLMFPAQQAGVCAAFLTAVSYSSLSGFSLPSQRAAIMLSIFSFTMLTYRKINPWNAWSLALLSVLIINPLTVLQESFWLSFGTIALILYGMSHRLFPSGIWWKYARVQWVIGIGLIPLTLALFQQCSLISFIANTIAIPWLGFAILPLCFISAVFICFSPSLATLFLLVADKSLAGLWIFLSWLAQFHVASFAIAIPNIYSFILLMAGFLILLLPAGIPGRWLGLIWTLPALLYQPLKPLPGEYWLSLLDVGQGLSVVIQTAKHTLVYDAGPKYEASSDMGENVVLPYLRKIKTKNIDLMVISHGDNDHIGGLESILNSFPLTHIKTSVPEKISLSQAAYCHAGDSWQWDGITFTFLYPFNNTIKSRNDNSCVLMIDNGQYKVLLPGDIEKQAEYHLLMNTPQYLKANLIIAPHHGSKTSGISAFISAVHPQVVLYATGYRNRYHFPHASVVATYEKMNVKSFNTVDSGTIQFKMTNGGIVLPPQEFRITNRKYWFDY